LKELGTIAKEKIDWLGNVTFAIGLFLILLGVTFGAFKFINLSVTLFAMATGTGLLVLFTFIERKVPRPMFDLSLFKIRVFTRGNIAIFLARGAFTLIMSFYLQGPSMKLNALHAGIYLIPVSIALAAFAPLSGWLYDKYKLWMSAALGLLISSIGFFLLIRIGTTTSFYQIVLPLFLVGAGIGIFASPNRASIMTSVPIYRRGASAGISTSFVMTGNAFSIGLVFLIMTNVIPLHVAEQLFSSSFGRSSQFSTAEVFKFLTSVRLIFFISAVMILVSVIPSVVRWRTKSK
jgi:MFS family permease